MSFVKPILQTSNPNRQVGTTNIETRTVYYGEVLSIDDPYDGGRIKVKVKELDSKKINTEDIPWCYPLMPKYFHIYPKVGEIVRVIIEDIKYPERSRFWIGSVISQLHKIEYDSHLTALSTTNLGLTAPEKAPSTIVEAKGIYPEKTDIGLIGRVNTDILLKDNQVQIRAGKYENNNPLKTNVKNPANITLSYNVSKDSNIYQSNTIVLSDKIALLSHSGEPKFKSVNITDDDKDNIFKTAHPIPRGDVLVEALKIIRDAIITHIHGYSNMPVDKTAIIDTLNNINFDKILSKNIVVN